MLFMFVTQINSQESVKGLREGAFSFIIHASTPKNGNKKNQFPGLLPIIETGQPTPSATPGLNEGREAHPFALNARHDCHSATRSFRLYMGGALFAVFAKVRVLNLDFRSRRCLDVVSSTHSIQKS
jgi:hypothetical protein